MQSFRPSLEVAEKMKKEDETDNYYTCLALRAAGKNDKKLLHYFWQVLI